jgi:acyl-CoA synthetase (AMP-forming)/AMP-acid ligase II
MLGYWRRPDATAETIRDGRLHTGDIGRLDARGYLSIVDRKNLMILRGGANVYPAEIERALHEDDRVEACAVVGVPDERLGERVAAWVQVAPGETLDPRELIEHCRKRLARYKVPEKIELIDEMPRNAMNKIVRRELPPIDLSG